MRTMLEFLRRLAGSLRPGRSDADLEEELRVHLELGGDRENRLRAGNLTHAMDSLRDQRGLPWLDALRSDLVFGWRQIARHRVASITAVLSLGLAMGAALAAFRLVDAVLLRPLPVADPSRLFVITKTSVDADQRPEERDDFDYPTYRKYVERTRTHADLMLMGMAVRRTVLIGAGESETAVQQFVSGNAFRTMGLQPALGRLLGESDDSVPGGHPVVVLSHDYWLRRFGGDSNVLGRTFRMGGRVYTIVGVLSRGFTGTEPGAVTDLFVPSMMNPEALNNPGWSWFRIWVRPKSGVEAGRVAAALKTDHRAARDEHEGLELQSASAGASATQKAFRQPLWILAVLAALLLLVACANVANLLLARAMSRKIEMALRLSIGAARRRLIQLLLVESAMLAILAAAVGALFATWAAPFVVSMLAPAERPVRLILDFDLRTLVTAVTLTVAVTMLFGLAPALRASSASLLDALKEVRGRPGHRRFADVLVAAQTAFCVFLLFGASLFVGTLQRLQDRPLGFSPDNLLTLRVDSARTRTPEEWAQIAVLLSEQPRIESAAVAGWAPLTGNRWRSSITVPGPATPQIAPNWVSVAPGYVQTMKMRLIDGREFRPGDRQPGKGDGGRPVPGVAIVNESFARVYFDGLNPVGQRVIVNSSNAPMEIVGLVADAMYFSVREVNHPGVFVPLEAERSDATLLVRTGSAAPDLRQSLPREIPRLIPGLVAREVVPHESIVLQQMIRERLLAALSTFFAVLGLALAMIGMYGVLNYTVTRERRDIGLRMALGARPGHVVTLIAARLSVMVLVGSLAGIGLGLAFGRFVRTLLFQLEATQPVALVPPLVALAIAAGLAVLPPAIRAVRTDPARTIRTEG